MSLKDYAAEKGESILIKAQHRARLLKAQTGYRLDTLRERMGWHVPAPKADDVNPDLERSLTEMGNALVKHAQAPKSRKAGPLQDVQRESRELRDEAFASGVRPAGLVHNLDKVGFANSDADIALGDAATHVFDLLRDRFSERKSEYAKRVTGVTPPLTAASQHFHKLANKAHSSGLTGVLKTLNADKADASVTTETGISAQQHEIARRALLKMAQGQLTVEGAANRIDVATRRSMFGYEHFAHRILDLQLGILDTTADPKSVKEMKAELKQINAAGGSSAIKANLPTDQAYSDAAKAMFSKLFIMPKDGQAHTPGDDQLVRMAVMMKPEYKDNMGRLQQLFADGAKRQGVAGRLRKRSEAESFGFDPAFCAVASKAISKTLTGEVTAREGHAMVVQAAVKMDAKLGAQAGKTGQSKAPKKSSAKLQLLGLTAAALAIVGAAYLVERPAEDNANTEAKTKNTTPEPTLQERFKSWLPGHKEEAKPGEPNKAWDIVIPEEKPAAPASAPARKFNKQSEPASAPASATTVTPARPAAKQALTA